MPATIYLVTGGCRSGKSRYAETICQQLCPNPIYLATAPAPGGGHKLSERDGEDDDFAQRIQRHQTDRGDHWTTIEEPLTPSKHATVFTGKAVLVDCLTLWLTNHMMEEGAFGDYRNNNDNNL